MATMEENEVKRREAEIQRKQNELEEKSRKNKLIRDTVSQQIKTLEVKCLKINSSIKDFSFKSHALIFR